jgi:hypothetical protein
MGRIVPETAGDIYLMSMTGAFPPKPLLATPAYEGAAQLSPDGRWMLYQSNASGQPEAYVRRYPELDRAWQVSEGGGGQTRWSRDGREIFYRNGVSMMAASFDGKASGEPVLAPPTGALADAYDFRARDLQPQLRPHSRRSFHPAPPQRGIRTRRDRAALGPGAAPSARRRRTPVIGSR